ncbi:MAG: biotin synthase BioB [Candidatus Omnitrophica bacterium CG12_big_fil_rev_8_21_14_0_65_50_5]|nr:MAG: biotin synthase BioB [Candidatus Omnitrophica bacterium CG12_big_fil_rev_8_21_14_0_65_50_5]
MERKFYSDLTDSSLAGEIFSDELCLQILQDKMIDIFPLLNAAYDVRKARWGKEVSIHIINNGQNGFCPEDCHYCAQAKSSKADIEEYPLKSDEEFLAEAKNAYEKGAHRYCMVFAGRGPSKGRVERLANLIRKIKAAYPVEVCVSAGLLDDEKAMTLKAAGLDQLNHNLNTSERNYPNICTTHTFQDRLNTMKAAHKAGIHLCSGLIVGMKDTDADIISVAKQLREMDVESIPVNFLIPIPGTLMNEDPGLTPEYCLRVLCLYRLLNPKAEVRVAAGRELHLRSLEVLALYPANSLFLDGYLNTMGADRLKTLQMIQDAGFHIKSEIDLDDIIANDRKEAQGKKPFPRPSEAAAVMMKTLKDLRPNRQPAHPTGCSPCG